MKLIISHIAPNMTETAFVALFAPYGLVSHTFTPPTGTVEVAQGTLARQALDGKELPLRGDSDYSATTALVVAYGGGL